MNSARTETIAYADCFSGVSGDMFIGALLAAGLPLATLEAELAKLNLGNFKLIAEENRDGAIKSMSFMVRESAKQPPRNWGEIKQFIEQSLLDAAIKEKSLAVFTVLAEAEAQVHGCSTSEIHFHEVGALDAIVDIVGSAIGLHHLDIDCLVTSPLPMPRGWVSCAHGLLPVPAPAVCEILKGVPVYGVELEQELVTPTGAALVKALSRQFGEFPPMTIAKVGYGAGSRKRSDNRPNLLRLVIGRRSAVDEAQEVQVIETNLDDWSPEGFPYLAERLFAQGALDVSLVPIQMKKGRPGFLLRVIAEPGETWEIKNVIFNETTAIGLRFRTEKRMTLPRQLGTVPTPWGRLRVKKVETPNGPRFYPEYEDCLRVARESGAALKDIQAAVGGCVPDDFREAGQDK